MLPTRRFMLYLALQCVSETLNLTVCSKPMFDLAYTFLLGSHALREDMFPILSCDLRIIESVVLLDKKGF